MWHTKAVWSSSSGPGSPTVPVHTIGVNCTTVLCLHRGRRTCSVARRAAVPGLTSVCTCGLCVCVCVFVVKLVHNHHSTSFNTSCLPYMRVYTLTYLVSCFACGARAFIFSSHVCLPVLVCGGAFQQCVRLVRLWKQVVP